MKVCGSTRSVDRSGGTLLQHQAIPAPVRHLWSFRHHCTRWPERQDLLDGPAYVRVERSAKLGILGQTGVFRSRCETCDEAPPEIGHVAVARVQLQHEGVAATVRRVRRRAAHDLSQIAGQSFDILGVLTGVGERVVQLGVSQTSGVVSGGLGEEGALTAGELVQTRTHALSFPRRDGDRPRVIGDKHFGRRSVLCPWDLRPSVW